MAARRRSGSRSPKTSCRLLCSNSFASGMLLLLSSSLAAPLRENDESAVIPSLALPRRFDLGKRDRLGLNAQSGTGRLWDELGHHVPEALNRGAPHAAPRDHQS